MALIRRFLLLLSLVGFALGSGAGSAGAQPSAFECPDMPDPTVSVDLDYQPPDIIDNVPETRLAGMFGRYHSEGVRQGYRIRGLHDGRIMLYSKLDMLKYTRSNSARLCLGLKALGLKVTFRPQIYVVAGVRKGTCEYNAVLEHEYKHLNTDLGIIRQYLSIIQRDAYRALGGLEAPVVIAQNQLSATKERWNQTIQTRMDRLMKSIEAERERRQALIDTPDEYRRVANQCR